MKNAMTIETSVMVTIDPKTGLHIGKANEAQVRAWLEQPVWHPAFRKAVRVGDVLVDEYTGPGVWFGGAGF